MNTEFIFPRIKIKPVFLKNEMPQSVLVEAKFSDEGLEITILGRHEKGRGQLLPAGQSMKMEEEDGEEEG